MNLTMSEIETRAAIDLDELSTFREINSGDAEVYIDTETGGIYFCYDGMIAGPEGEIEEDEVNFEDERYTLVEPSWSSEGFEQMEQFIEAMPEGRAKDRLSDAIRQKKPFRKFKDALYDYPDVQKTWYAYERYSELYQAANWLKIEGIKLPVYCKDGDETLGPSESRQFKALMLDKVVEIEEKMAKGQFIKA